MPIAPDLSEILRCPRTGGLLNQHEEGLVSADGKHLYPLINGIPWLLPTPQNSLMDWRAKLNHFNQVLLAEIKSLEQDMKSSQGATQARIEKLLQGKKAFLRRVSELMYPVVTAQAASKGVYDALRDRAPHTQNLLSYEANLYRDWVWGDEENERSADIVYQHIKDLGCERMAVLGAGAGRLALDLHQQVAPGLTVATDINPLLVMAAQHILNGQNLSIYEFPLQPRQLDYVAVEHEINARKKPDNFHFVFSDAAQPCFEKAAFDLVLTPWFIDIQPLEFGRFLRQLNQYIPVGGHWVNFGSLVFNQNRDVLCYSIDEVKAIALAQGFEISNAQEHEVPYLKSPYNAGYRMERVWTWTAKKIEEREALKSTQVIPPWLRDEKQAIPKAQYFQQFSFTHRTYAQLTAEVDGKTSVSKIARKLAKQNKMDETEATHLVKEFFLDIYRQNNP